MKNKIIIPILIIYITISSINCKKTEIEQFNIKGSIIGSVAACPEHDIWYNFVETDISVKIENTNFSTIAEDRKYTFDNIPAGTYNFVFSSDGFSDTKKCGVQIIGGEYPQKLPSVLIVKKSTTVASNLTVEYNNNEIIFSANISPEATDEKGRGINVFIYDDENVAFDKNIDVYNKTIPTGDMPSLSFDYEDMASWIEGFNPEKTYYAVAYGTSAFATTWVSYFDPDKGSYVYPGVNETPTNVVSFKVPEK